MPIGIGAATGAFNPKPAGAGQSLTVGGGPAGAGVGGAASGAGPGESFRDQMRQQQMERRFITQAGTFVQQAVTLGATTKSLTFEREESDTSYGIAATPSWATTCHVSARTSTGCTLTFGTAAPANATVDAIVFRG